MKSWTWLVWLTKDLYQSLIFKKKNKKKKFSIWNLDLHLLKNTYRQLFHITCYQIWCLCSWLCPLYLHTAFTVEDTHAFVFLYSVGCETRLWCSSVPSSFMSASYNLKLTRMTVTNLRGVYISALFFKHVKYFTLLPSMSFSCIIIGYVFIMDYWNPSSQQTTVLTSLNAGFFPIERTKYCTSFTLPSSFFPPLNQSAVSMAQRIGMAPAEKPLLSGESARWWEKHWWVLFPINKLMKKTKPN